MQPYISLTVHFVNDDWTLRSVCLQTAYFPDDHKGEIIPQGLKDALSSWNLAEDRLVCMTTDSGTNMIKALQDNEWPNLQYFRHRLHNAIGKSLMAIHSSEIYFLVRKRPMNSLINALYQTDIYFHKIGMNNHNDIRVCNVNVICNLKEIVEFSSRESFMIL